MLRGAKGFDEIVVTVCTVHTQRPNAYCDRTTGNDSRFCLRIRFGMALFSLQNILLQVALQNVIRIIIRLNRRRVGEGEERGAGDDHMTSDGEGTATTKLGWQKAECVPKVTSRMMNDISMSKQFLLCLHTADNEKRKATIIVYRTEMIDRFAHLGVCASVRVCEHVFEAPRSH